MTLSLLLNGMISKGDEYDEIFTIVVRNSYLFSDWTLWNKMCKYEFREFKEYSKSKIRYERSKQVFIGYKS